MGLGVRNGKLTQEFWALDPAWPSLKVLSLQERTLFQAVCKCKHHTYKFEHRVVYIMYKDMPINHVFMSITGRNAKGEFGKCYKLLFPFWLHLNLLTSISQWCDFRKFQVVFPFFPLLMVMYRILNVIKQLFKKRIPTLKDFFFEALPTPIQLSEFTRLSFLLHLRHFLFFREVYPVTWNQLHNYL